MGEPADRNQAHSRRRGGRSTNLLGATVVGRHAGLAAACARDIGRQPGAGAGYRGRRGRTRTARRRVAAAGLSWAVVGCTFAAVGAVVAQLTESAAAARGIGGAVLAAAFVLRAASDATGAVDGGPWLSCSPRWAWRTRSDPSPENDGGSSPSLPWSPHSRPWRWRCRPDATSALGWSDPDSARPGRPRGCAGRSPWPAAAPVGTAARLGGRVGR